MVIYCQYHNNFDLRTCHKARKSANTELTSREHGSSSMGFWWFLGKRLPHGSWHRSPEVHAPLSVDQELWRCLGAGSYLLLCPWRWWRIWGPKKKKKQHLSSIIILEPSSASSLEKLEISYARDLILNSWKIKGLHARWISEHLCTLRDGALDQARHMWPQGRVQPTEQTAQRPIHHTTRRNQLPLKTKRW